MWNSFPDVTSGNSSLNVPLSAASNDPLETSDTMMSLNHHPTTSVKRRASDPSKDPIMTELNARKRPCRDFPTVSDSTATGTPRSWDTAQSTSATLAVSIPPSNTRNVISSANITSRTTETSSEEKNNILLVTQAVAHYQRRQSLSSSSNLVVIQQPLQTGDSPQYQSNRISLSPLGTNRNRNTIYPLNIDNGGRNEYRNDKEPPKQHNTDCPRTNSTESPSGHTSESLSSETEDHRYDNDNTPCPKDILTNGGLQARTGSWNTGDTSAKFSDTIESLISAKSMDRISRLLQLVVPIIVSVIVAGIVVPVRPAWRQLQFPRNRLSSFNDDSTGGSHWNMGTTWWSNKSRKTASKASTTIGMGERVKALTLRDVLLDDERGFHLAMAPAFFGFYGYFGALAAWTDAVRGSDVSKLNNTSIIKNDRTTTSKVNLPLKSVAGASAGAMAAVLLAAGISPTEAADFCANMTVDKFADFPGFGAVFRGNKFERLMEEFLESSSATPESPLLTMEDATLPVAVTAFDLQTMTGEIITTGSMARAARASATFPLLFQPVAWDNAEKDCIFIDGGVTDTYGMMGLTKTMTVHQDRTQTRETLERVINLRVGSFGQAVPPGPDSLPGNPEVISISIEGLPLPGPWAMKNGPLAFAAARRAMANILDVPLKPIKKRPVCSKQDGPEDCVSVPHYKLTIDAS